MKKILSTLLLISGCLTAMSDEYPFNYTFGPNTTSTSVHDTLKQWEHDDQIQCKSGGVDAIISTPQCRAAFKFYQENPDELDSPSYGDNEVKVKKTPFLVQYPAGIQINQSQMQRTETYFFDLNFIWQQKK